MFKIVLDTGLVIDGLKQNGLDFIMDGGVKFKRVRDNLMDLKGNVLGKILLVVRSGTEHPSTTGWAKFGGKVI